MDHTQKKKKKKKKKKYFLTFDLYGLDLGATDLGLAQDASSHDGQHFCQVISKSIMESQSYGPDRKKKALFLTLTSKCDLDLEATDLENY